MGVEVAHSTVDLAENRGVGYGFALYLQAVGDICHLLAQGGGRGVLTVGAGEHGLGGALLCQPVYGGDDLVHCRQHHCVTGFLQHQAVGEVVDILRGTGEVDELGDSCQGCGSQFLLEKIFHRLDVVVGHPFDLFYPCRVLHRKTIDYGGKKLFLFGVQQGNFRYVGLICQGPKPGRFHLHPKADQAVLGKYRPQIGNLAAITPVQRA